VLVGAIAVSLVPFASKPAWACSCAVVSHRHLAERSDAVFTGTVAGVTEGRDRVVNFDVDSVYKGERSASIDVHTPLEGPTCGARFTLNRRYTVFAALQDGALWTTSCDAPKVGGIDPAAYGLPPGVTGLHRALSPWLIAFTALAAVVLVVAVVIAARRRRASDAGGR
jgi:hypothetical protein